MRKLLHMTFLLVGASIFLMACNQSMPEPQQEVPEQPESAVLWGTWERISFAYTSPASTTAGDASLWKEIKIFTPTHFMWIANTGDNTGFVSAGGGRYTYEDGIFTEILEYHSAPELIGAHLPFEMRVEGDTMYFSGTFPGKELLGVEHDTHLEEKWRRVE